MKNSIVALLVACSLNVVLPAAAQQTGGAAPPVYVVMSLIGDTISVVNFGGLGLQTGSRIDQSRHQEIPIKENAFDAAALNTIAEVVRKQEPAAAQEMLETRNATLRRMQDHIFDNDDAARRVRESLKALLKERNATRFILVTKHKAEGQVPLTSGTVTTGMLEGLGFYVDNSLQLRNSESLEGGHGLIAGFVHVTLWLVDAQSMNVLRELPVMLVRPIMRVGSREDAPTTWDRLSDAQKVRQIESLIHDSLNRALPKLLEAAS